MSKITDTISWLMDSEKIVKLEKLNKTYDIDDKVEAVLIKKGIYTQLEDKKVEVEIDESKGENGLITFLRVVEANTESKEEKKEEVKDEKPKETKTDTPDNNPDLVVKEITVGGVSVEKAGVVDKDTKVWYTLDSTINAQKFKDECTRKTIQITVAPQEKGNDVIKSYILKEEEKKETTSTSSSANTFKKSYDNNTQTSIEAQASMNSANRVVQAMVDKDSKPDFVEKLITKIAKHNFKTIQELKTKKE